MQTGNRRWRGMEARDSSWWRYALPAFSATQIRCLGGRSVALHAYACGVLAVVLLPQTLALRSPIPGFAPVRCASYLEG
jgi:hypothetical protein